VWHWTGFAWRVPDSGSPVITLVVEQATAAALAARYTLPARDSEFLRPEPLVQSGDPRIVTQARKIIGGERDPARAAGWSATGCTGTSRETATRPCPARARC